jgi:hypothetical protein
MSDYNIIIYILEDDKNMNSSFYYDLTNLLQKNSSIPINIKYHAHYFFGNLLMSISGDKMLTKKIKEIPLNYNDIKKDMTKFYNSHYKKGRKNIFIYGGHSNYLFNTKHNIKDIHKKTTVTITTNIFENFHDIHLVILDACYTSFTDLLNTLPNKTKYMLGCQTPGPNYGYISKDFLGILNSNMNDIDKYKTLIDRFIERNENKAMPYKKFNYRTDGVLIDMDRYNDMMEEYNNTIINNILKKNNQCKVEDYSGYNYYDMLCSIKNNNINSSKLIEKINSCILYSKMNKLSRKFYASKNKKLTGISIGIL